MVHELRIQTKVFAQSERRRIVFVVLAEFLTLNRTMWQRCTEFMTTPTKRMSIRSTHLSTSGLSSVSARYTAIRAIITAAHSWSKPAPMWWMLAVASAQFRATVLTLIRLWPLECYKHHIKQSVIKFRSNLPDIEWWIGYSLCLLAELGRNADWPLRKTAPPLC